MKNQKSRAQALAQRLAPVSAESSARPHLVLPEGRSLNTLQNATGLLSCIWKWIKKQQVARSNNKRLQVAATVSLGEKRFVAVIQVDGQEFLVGGGPTNVSLLAQLGANVPFGDLLKDSINDGVKTQPADRARGLADSPAINQVREQA
jgi:hypothetical protein